MQVVNAHTGGVKLKNALREASGIGGIEPTTIQQLRVQPPNHSPFLPRYNQHFSLTSVSSFLSLAPTSALFTKEKTQQIKIHQHLEAISVEGTVLVSHIIRSVTEYKWCYKVYRVFNIHFNSR